MAPRYRGNIVVGGTYELHSGEKVLITKIDGETKLGIKAFPTKYPVEGHSLASPLITWTWTEYGQWDVCNHPKRWKCFKGRSIRRRVV